MTDAHKQRFTHSYVVSYPEHEPRKDDPNYVDFEAYRRRTKATAQCAYAVEVGDDSECDHDNPLELHHSHIEFALQNGVSLERLERVYPGVSDREHVGQWVESGENLLWLCRWHHRGQGGVHSASSSDYEASHFVQRMIEHPHQD